MHIVWHLPASFPTDKEMQVLAQDAGVGVYSLEAAAACDFRRNECSDRALALGYSSVREKQIREGVARLAAALNTAV